MPERLIHKKTKHLKFMLYGQWVFIFLLVLFLANLTDMCLILHYKVQDMQYRTLGIEKRLQLDDICVTKMDVQKSSNLQEILNLHKVNLEGAK